MIRESFDDKYEIDPVTECWNWARAKDKDGYGKYKDGRAHRYSWEMANGLSIPPGKLICHSCDNPSCVNPDHLFIGTHAANHADRGRKGRAARGENHGRAKITADQVVEIRNLRPGSTAAQQQYGIGKTQYHRILNSKVWRHV